jgi:hypothetical protein
LFSWYDEEGLPYDGDTAVHVVCILWEATLSKHSILGATMRGLLQGEPRFLSNCVDRSVAVGKALVRLAISKLDSELDNLPGETTFAILSHSIGTHAAYRFVQCGPKIPLFNIMFNPHLYRDTVLTEKIKPRAPTIMVMNWRDEQLRLSARFLPVSVGSVANKVDKILVSEGCQVILIHDAEARAYGDQGNHSAYLNPSMRDIVFEMLNEYRPRSIVQSRKIRFGDFHAVSDDVAWVWCTAYFSDLSAAERLSLTIFFDATRIRYLHQLSALPLKSMVTKWESETMDSPQDFYFGPENARFHGWRRSDITKYKESERAYVFSTQRLDG